VIGRVVEIATDGRRLSVERGFMLVEGADGESGRVALDDIGVLLVNAHGVTYSNTLLVKLAERGAAVVLCAANHSPVAWLWPIDAHHEQTARMRAQLDAGRPLCKRLWQALVHAKVLQQAAVLEALGRPAGGVAALAAKVRSGDPDNIEAQAARRYWPLVMGPEFRRDRTGGGANVLLNYGYTVLRATCARAVTAAGLHPSVGVHHRTRADPLCLASDVMEPFRPIVDLAVARLSADGRAALDPEVKAALVAVLGADMQTARGTTPLSTCVERLAVSLAQAFASGEARLELPLAPLPLDAAGLGRL